MKILVLTVGGSCAPIITSIKQNKSDRLVFICSDDIGNTKGSYITVEGTGNVCGNDPKKPDLPNIVTQAQCENTPREIHKLKAVDNINEVYKFCLNLLNKLRQEYSDAEIIADYTGGTKTMSVGLGAAAMDIEGTIISIVKGERTDLIKVLDGTQSVRLLRTNLGYLNRQKSIAEKFIAQYDYAAAANLLSELSNTPDIPEQYSNEITHISSFCKAFDAWDKFNHLEAFRLLSPLKSEYLHFLTVSIQARAKLDEEIKLDTIPNFKSIQIAHGYELVEDLLLNVERRSHSGKYDDAVARLYRAFELLGQLRLIIQYDLKTSDIDLTKIPNNLKKEYDQKKNNKGRIELGATQTYDLLDKLGDEIGQEYNKIRNKILNQGLGIRNLSILAHGFKPISEIEYSQVSEVLGGFIQNILAELTKGKKTFKKQFPTRFDNSLN
jgi:CRISPR-associated protein (TIGR02710 family)